MREIYSKAWTPIVWTGGEADDSDSALNLIRILADEYAGLDNSVIVLA